MATKECPSCGADVPVVAHRCKHCFHDFNEEPPKKKMGGLVALLGFIALLALLAAATVAYIYEFRSQEQIMVNQETKDIVITSTSAKGIDTQRVPFDTVARLQYIIGGDSAMFETFAITKDGDKHLIGSSETPNRGDADHMAAVIGVPVEEVQNLRGFGD